MTQEKLGRLEAVPPRDIWAHEAHDFTPWLSDNIDRLEEILGIDISIEAREHPVGSFSLDLYGTDLTHDKPLIIENQLEQSDHGHLGQLLTYAAGTKAGTIVWVAPRIRDEHRSALQWLNDHTGLGLHFFGVELKVVRIGASAPAPLLEAVVMPSDWQKLSAAAVAKKPSRYAGFWNQLQEHLLIAAPVLIDKPIYRAAAHFRLGPQPRRYCSLIAVFASDERLRFELFIKAPTIDQSHELYRVLEAHKAELEKAYGSVLEWEFKDDRISSRIAEYRAGSIENEADYGEYIDFFLDSLLRFQKALDSIGFSDDAGQK